MVYSRGSGGIGSIPKASETYLVVKPIARLDRSSQMWGGLSGLKP